MKRSPARLALWRDVWERVDEEPDILHGSVYTGREQDRDTAGIYVPNGQGDYVLKPLNQRRRLGFR